MDPIATAPIYNELLPEAKADTAKKPSNKAKIIAVVALILAVTVIVAVVFIVTFYLTKKTDNTSSDSPSSASENTPTAIMKAQLEESAAFIRSKAPGFSAVLGIQLGTGSSEMADNLDEHPKPIVIPYADIPYFPICTVQDHPGNLICGYYGGIPVYCLNGRIHYYEGVPLNKTTYPIRALAQLGVKSLILTNAAGCLQTQWNLGDIMLVSDHINALGTNPLIGQNLDLFPPHSVRFPSLIDCYDATLREQVKAAADEIGLANKLREGVYVATFGPTYETIAEINYFRMIGADAVGMSTVPEVIVARHSGIRCLAFSVLTNICGADEEPNADDIIRVGREASAAMLALLRKILPAMETMAVATATEL